MSSHHVVREAQEPALLILDAGHLLHPRVAPLLEWSPTIVVTAEGLKEIASLGIKVDIVVFDQDQRFAVMEQTLSQEPVSLVPVVDKENKLLKALVSLAEKGHQAVNILTSPDLEDKKALLKDLAEQNFIPNLVLLNGQEKWALFRSKSFTKWFPAKETVKIQPAFEKAKLTTSGFVENLMGEETEEQHILQTADGGTITVTSSEAFWVTEQLD